MLVSIGYQNFYFDFVIQTYRLLQVYRPSTKEFLTFYNLIKVQSDEMFHKSKKKSCGSVCSQCLMIFSHSVIYPSSIYCLHHEIKIKVLVTDTGQPIFVQS